MQDVFLLKEELAATVRSWHAKGWSPATSTNYSFRVAHDPEMIHISRSGVDKFHFSEEDFMEVTADGTPTPLYKELRPSAETLIHCVLYEMFPETMYIVHSHSVYSVLHSAVLDKEVKFEGYEVLKAYEGITTHDTSVSCPIFDNTQDMVAFSAMLRENRDKLTIPAFIMRKHGTYAWGKTLFEAKRHLETTEYLLECEWKLRTMNK
jgi:methylthioribulose-1-phosphate dehydratase